MSLNSLIRLKNGLVGRSIPTTYLPILQTPPRNLQSPGGTGSVGDGPSFRDRRVSRSPGVADVHRHPQASSAWGLHPRRRVSRQDDRLSARCGLHARAGGGRRLERRAEPRARRPIRPQGTRRAVPADLRGVCRGAGARGRPTVGGRLPPARVDPSRPGLPPRAGRGGPPPRAPRGLGPCGGTTTRSSALPGWWERGPE